MEKIGVVAAKENCQIDCLKARNQPFKKNIAYIFVVKAKGRHLNLSPSLGK